MKLNEIRDMVRQVIAEAKKENKLPKSSGKLVHLKKELTSLKKMKESLGQYNINENTTEEPTADFSHMQKFVNELNKLKAASAKLSETLDNQIKEVENKIQSETQKIKEMIGLSEPTEEEHKEEELEEAKKKPSAGLTKKEKSNIVKKARAGKDIGKPGKGFEKVAKAAGGGEKGKKIAAAQMWKQQAKK